MNAAWHIEPGRPQEPGTLYLGADPGVLFRSDDGGETWEPNLGILEHPTRDRWLPGAAGICCHSIQLDPSDSQRQYVGITSAGTFRTDDGGATWMPLNKNVAPDFLPDASVEVGQCVHKLLLHPARPERLWQQNHCGVYRSDDHGGSWERLDGNGLPSGFGFALMLDPKGPDAAFVIPEKSPEYHYSPDGRLKGLRDARRGPDLAVHLRRPARTSLGRRAPRGLGLRRPLAVLRHPERLLLRTRRRRHLGRGGTAPSADPFDRGHTMVQIVLPGVLADQAEGRARFDIEAETVGEALRALPVADLLFNERGEWNRYLNVYVDGTDARERGGIACPLAGAREVRVLAHIAGG